MQVYFGYSYGYPVSYAYSIHNMDTYLLNLMYSHLYFDSLVFLLIVTVIIFGFLLVLYKLHIPPLSPSSLAQLAPPANGDTEDEDH